MSVAALLQDLDGFDGKNIPVLRDIRGRYPPSSELIDALITAAVTDDTRLQTGATWLLRAWLEDGQALSADQLGRLTAMLLDLHDGFGRLHVCQAMDALTVPEEHAEAFADFFRSCRSTRNTFLRAWAPHGFLRLAQQHERFLDEARTWVEEALSDPAPSVRARARRSLEST